MLKRRVQPQNPLARAPGLGRAMRTGLGVVLLSCWAALAAHAVVIASGDSTGNISPPPDDPGFAHVGVLNGLAGVYLGNGWVISAWHVGAAPFAIGGITYQPVAGSETRLQGPDSVPPDLMLVKIDGDPGLPSLPLAGTSPGSGRDVILIGHGRDRDQPLDYQGHAGWTTQLPFTTRWGSNEISHTSQLVAGQSRGGASKTQSIATRFDAPGATAHESQAVLGDSGGGLFWKQGSKWVLAGTLFAATMHTGQPEHSAVEGNLVIAADLAHYRAQILTIVEVPGCRDGLDDDSDGLTDHPDDPGCTDANDVWETSPELACDDGLDNDGDGLVDYPDDPQCVAPASPSEAPALPAGAAWSASAASSTARGAGLSRADALCSCRGSRRTRARSRPLPRRARAAP